MANNPFIIGVCAHCNDFYANVKPNWHTDERGKRKLEELVSKIKEEGVGRDFDCLLGMSGGVDSSYMLHYAITELCLRPLVLYVNGGGWNTPLAEKKIRVMVDKLNVELYTQVID